MSDIKPIETKYKGHRFRSRLEARWAIFMDTLGVPWEYEKQGYAVDGKPYLPDFWLPYARGPEGGGFHLEIKPNGYDFKHAELFKSLAAQSGHSMFVIVGNPWPGEHSIAVYSHTRDGRSQTVRTHGEFTVHTYSHYFFADCSRPPELCETDSDIGSHWMLTSPFDTGPHGEPHASKAERLRQAFVASRSARFEHGEQP